MISPVITFAVFKIIALRDSTSFDFFRMFTSLSLILLLTQPLFYVFIGIEELIASIGCFERIGKFLMSEARKDYRLILSSTQSEEQSNPVFRRSIGWQGETHDGIELASLHSRPRGLSSISNIAHFVNSDEVQAVLVGSGTFGWTENGDPTLHDINLSILRSEVTILVSSVPSGNPTLLKALLGEIHSSKGFVYASSPEIAWCEQTPWLIVCSSPLSSFMS
jgi:ATP-binding cassette, subfamily C (CFTR/MRP), member 1